MMAKAPSLPADEVFLDLEDAVALSQKETARALVIEALRGGDWSATPVGVRVNAVSTPWCRRDVIDMVEGAGGVIDFVIIPKAEYPSDVTFVADLVHQVREANGIEREIGLEVQIESATGLTNVDAIAAASDRTQTLVFGPADMSASLGMPALTAGLPQPGYPGDHWHHVMVRILVAARAAGLEAIDGPYLMIRDLEGLRASALRARALGFDGKWAVHPSQIDVLNEVFAPTNEEFEKAQAMILGYQRSAGEQGRGAFMFGDEMIDEASRKMAERVVARGRAAGLGPRPGLDQP
jgi:citrate lyase subunit beta / citryl-CoA lyase